MTPFQRLSAVSLAFVALTAMMTAPLAWNATSALPYADDAYFSVWRLAWVAHQLVNQPSKLFDTNIFYPASSTLAYSDAMLLLGIVGAPAIWAGVHPVLVHNILLLAGFALSGVGAFVLTRHLVGKMLPAVLAGIIFAFAPYKFGHFAHLELQWTAWMPFALWAVHRLLETSRLRFGLLLGALVALQGLSSLYYLAFFGPFIVCILVGDLNVRSRASKKQVTALCLAWMSTDNS